MNTTPDHARALELFNAGRTAEAQACLQALCNLQPDDWQAHFLLGITLQTRKKFPEATTAYRRAVELDQAALEPRFNLGVCLQHQGEFDAAVEVYRK